MRGFRTRQIGIPADPAATVSHFHTNKGTRSIPGMADYSEIIAQFQCQGSILTDGNGPIDGLPISIGHTWGHTHFKVNHGLGEVPTDVDVQVIATVLASEYRDVAGGSEDTNVLCRDEDVCVENLRYTSIYGNARTRYMDTWASGLIIAKPAFPFADREFSYFTIAFASYPWVSIVKLDSSGKATISSAEETGVILTAFVSWAGWGITRGVGDLGCNVGVWNTAGVGLSHGPLSVNGPIRQGTAPVPSAGNSYLWGYPTRAVREIFVASSAGVNDGEKICIVTAICGPQVDMPITVKVISKVDKKPGQQARYENDSAMATHSG